MSIAPSAPGAQYGMLNYRQHHAVVLPDGSTAAEEGNKEDDYTNNNLEGKKKPISSSLEHMKGSRRGDGEGSLLTKSMGAERNSLPRKSR